MVGLVLATAFKKVFAILNHMHPHTHLQSYKHYNFSMMSLPEKYTV